MSADMDEIFAAGPKGFLNPSAGPSRLRQYVCAMNEGLPLVFPPPAEVAETAEADETAETSEEAPEPEADESDEGREELKGADAWQNEAMRKWHGLWHGDTSTLKEVFNTEAPAQLLAFEDATLGANTWSTFTELRLDAALMQLPPEDENLFEKCILNDQLNYLGTALPEVFSGLVCIGTLGNGDSYHLELSPPEGQEEPMVFFYDHETHSFEWAFSVDLESLAYVAALCRAVDDERVSESVATAGYEALRGRVAPSWHFSMDERDEDFEGFEKAPNECAPLFLFWRSLWMTHVFRHNGHVDIRDMFTENLNVVLPAEHVPARMEIASRSTSTALYATWRAYLFDEPELSQYLEICRKHPGRLVRDAAKLIDELRGGRKALGRIADWPALLEKFRAMDLDPRRKAAREAEAEARKRNVEAERATVRAELLELQGDAEYAYVAERLSRPELAGTMFHVLLSGPSRAAAKEAADFLLEQGYSRDNCLYRHEQHDAVRHLATHSDAALHQVILGSLVHGSDADENEPMIGGNDLLLALMHRPQLVKEEGLSTLQGKLESLELEDPSWYEHSVVRLAGRLGDARFVPPLRALLAQIPSEGEFETALKYDTFLGYLGESLRLIGDASAAPELTPFAESASMRLRKARAHAALAIATIAPDAFTDVMAERALEFVTQMNDPEENTMALLAVAKARPGFEAAQGVEPSSKRKPQTQLAMAIVAQDDAAIATALHLALTKRGYDDKGTIAQRRLALLACELFGITPETDSLKAACGFDVELDAKLTELGEFNGPKRVTWFEAKAMSPEALQEVLTDSSVVGRCHAARAAQGDESARAALESAVRSLLGLEGKISDDPRYLLKEAMGVLLTLPEAESTTALCDEMLKHASKDIKDPILRHLPPWKSLKEGMEFVRDAKWGWQESAATGWLEEHG